MGTLSATPRKLLSVMVLLWPCSPPTERVKSTPSAAPIALRSFSSSSLGSPHLPLRFQHSAVVHRVAIRRPRVLTGHRSRRRGRYSQPPASLGSLLGTPASLGALLGTPRPSRNAGGADSPGFPRHVTPREVQSPLRRPPVPPDPQPLAARCTSGAHWPASPAADSARGSADHTRRRRARRPRLTAPPAARSGAVFSAECAPRLLGAWITGK